MKFPLTEQLIDEARRFSLRSACRDCFYWRPARGSEPAPGACAHDWPDEGQRRWPIDAPDPDGTRPTEVAFCKEFELR
ncbi:MAG TPA: hypothetical protein VGC42_01765 [Kofleriaceae bacterium]